MRKEKTVVLDDRGNKLTFKIREMSATDMSFWALRAFKALGAAGIELPDGADIRTALKLISANFQTMCKNIDLGDVRGLLDDLLRMCSRVVARPKSRSRRKRSMIIFRTCARCGRCMLKRSRSALIFSGTGSARNPKTPRRSNCTTRRLDRLQKHNTDDSGDNLKAICDAVRTPDGVQHRRRA